MNSSFSIQKQTPTVEVGDPQNLPLGDPETQTLGGDSIGNRIAAFSNMNAANYRRYYSVVTVTRTPVAAATVTTTTTEKVELPSQQVIYLRLVYGF